MEMQCRQDDLSGRAELATSGLAAELRSPMAATSHNRGEQAQIVGTDFGTIVIFGFFAIFGLIAIVTSLRNDDTNPQIFVAAAVAALALLSFAPLRVSVNLDNHTITFRSLLRTRTRQIEDLRAIIRPILGSQVRLHFDHGSDVVVSRGVSSWTDIEAALVRKNHGVAQQSSIFW